MRPAAAIGLPSGPIKYQIKISQFLISAKSGKFGLAYKNKAEGSGG